MTDAFAFESTVSNAIRGLGTDTFNQSADFGSGGTLESVLVMDRVAKWGDDPNAKILGENSALAVIAHETGHRWLTQFQFNDGRGGDVRRACSAGSAPTGASSWTRTRP